MLIYTGIGAMRFDLLWIGGLSVAALSLAVNRALALIDSRARRWQLAGERASRTMRRARHQAPGAPTPPERNHMNASITRRGAIVLIGTSALALMGATGLSGCGKGGSAAGAVTVGSKAFTEGVILSELYALALEDAGLEVDRAFEISGSLIHTALVEGDIDLYPEYTGTA